MTADPQPNVDTIRSHAAAAITANATFQALASPTTAQITAQVKALTRQVNALLRMDITGDLTNVSDT